MKEKKSPPKIKDDKLLKRGIVGSAIAAVFCFTPVLVVLFGIAGLSAYMGWWLDYFVLYPSLAIFLGITAYAIYRRRNPCAAAHRCDPPPPDELESPS